MRKTVFAVLFACIATCAATGSTASAESLQFVQVASSTKQTQATIVFDQIHKVVEAKASLAQSNAEAQQAEYEVKSGDSLAIIASDHETTWKRLYDKNVSITNPDIIEVGLKLIIPKTDEILTERQLAQTPAVAMQASTQQAGTTYRSTVSASVSFSGPATSAGNSYVAGYCTWYAKNMRPDLPNNLGNANTWVSRAAAQGYATGSTPQVGAIGQQGMHVVYIQSVNGDGTVTTSEMNYTGLYQVSSRTVPASTFMYIY